jgi:hypothetical protein
MKLRSEHTYSANDTLTPDFTNVFLYAPTDLVEGNACFAVEVDLFAHSVLFHPSFVALTGYRAIQ